MSKPKKIFGYKYVESVATSKEAREAGILWTQGTNHGRLIGPAGRGYMAVSRHPGDFGTKLCIKIRNWFAALGVVMAFFLMIWTMIAPSAQASVEVGSTIYIPVVQNIPLDMTNTWPCMEPGVCEGDSYAMGQK